MIKEEIVDPLRRILNTDADLNFRSILGPTELETLVVCIRHRIEQEKGRPHSSGVD